MSADVVIPARRRCETKRTGDQSTTWDPPTVKQAIVFGEAPICDPQPIQAWFPFPERTAVSFNKSVGYRYAY